jgi:hypothetical protein
MGGNKKQEMHIVKGSRYGESFANPINTNACMQKKVR